MRSEQRSGFLEDVSMAVTGRESEQERIVTPTDEDLDYGYTIVKTSCDFNNGWGLNPGTFQALAGKGRGRAVGEEGPRGAGGRKGNRRGDVQPDQEGLKSRSPLHSSVGLEVS